MGTIQSSTGLASGIDYEALVDSLMELATARRDLVSERNDNLESEQVAVSSLSALLLALRYTTDALGATSIYDERQATSSNESVLSATVSGTPNVGTYQFTAVRTVQTEQWLSSGFKSDTEALGEGQISLRFGEDVQRSTPLEVLNGGEGFDRGKIRITDRSGATAQIDLTAVQTLDDVLDAINTNTTINVTAVAQGDGIRLIDNTGQTTSNLKVQEVSGGTTAASLGLADIDVASSTADGEDVIWLSEDIELNSLNDGNGVCIGAYDLAGVLENLTYTLRDGTTAEVSLFPTDSSGGDDSLTLGDVIDAFNQIDPEKLRMEISEDGERLVVHDLTEGDGTFSLSTIDGRESALVEDLGLTGASEDGVITGRRLLGGTQSVLLSSLNGGNGLGELGTIELTDRSGASDTVDLSAAETLQDVIDAINAADVGITAEVNQAKTGIVLTDTTGKSASNLIVADADGSGTASKLGLEADVAATSVNTGDLHLQVISYNTKLADLNGGAGVALGSFTITDGSGNQSTVDLSDGSVETVGDLLDKIRQETGVTLTAEINATGDGIQLRDYSGSSTAPTITEGSSTTAADLHLLGGAELIDYDGEQVYAINGSTTTVIEIDADDTLDDLRQKINDLDLGVTANTLTDGSKYHLSLSSDKGGQIGTMVIDSSQAGFSIEETVEGKDALLLYGSASSNATNVLCSSRTNSFSGVVVGLKLTIAQASTSPVTITVSRSSESLVSNMSTLVERYNSFRETYDELTAYDSETDEAGVLLGSSTALRVEQAMSSLISGWYSDLGSVQSLVQLGITIADDGSLSLDEDKLEEAFAEDPDAIRDFFVGTSAEVLPSDLGITISGGWITVDEETLNAKYAEDPQAVIEYFGRVRDRYSWEQLGITFTEDGIEVDGTVLQSVFTSDADVAEKLAIEETDGLSDKFAAALDALCDVDNSTLTNRFNTLADKIAENEEQIARMDENLEVQETRLYMQFYRLELALSKLQTNMDALDAFTPVEPIGSSSDD